MEKIKKQYERKIKKLQKQHWADFSNYSIPSYFLIYAFLPLKSKRTEKARKRRKRRYLTWFKVRIS